MRMQLLHRFAAVQKQDESARTSQIWEEGEAICSYRECIGENSCLETCDDARHLLIIDFTDEESGDVEVGWLGPSNGAVWKCWAELVLKRNKAVDDGLGNWDGEEQSHIA